MPKSSLFGMPARYLATPPTLSDGDAVPLLVDENGALVTTNSGGSITPSEESYTVSNYTPTRTLDASNYTEEELVYFLCTLVSDLKATGIVQ